MKARSHSTRLRVGDTFEIASVRRLDLRKWPRFKAWILRRPAPMLEQLVRFKVTKVLP